MALKHGPDVFPEAAETRTTTFTYKSASDHQNGYLDKITDAVGRVVQFGYDRAGRVTTQTFQPGSPTDERVITYDYDASGNLDTILPPGKPFPHEFNYTPIDLEEYYAPPGIDGDPNPDTTFVYTPDRELDLILPPDADNDLNFDYEATSGRLKRVTIP
jgi:YD repeat-containing protein